MTDIPWQAWAALVSVLSVFAVTLFWWAQYRDEQGWLRRQRLARRQYTYRGRGRKK